MEGNARRIVGFTAVSHGLVHTYELSIPILMTVWLVEFPVTAATLGGVVAAGYGLFGAGALPAGVLVDRFGSKPLIVACNLGMGASFLVLAVADSVVAIALTIGFWGVAASVYHPAGLALLSKGVDRSGIALGYHGIGGNLGIALGPLCTALLLLEFGWRVVAAALAVPALAVVVYGFVVDLDETAGVDGDGDSANATSEISVGNLFTDTRLLFTLGFSLVVVVVTLNGLYYRAFLTFLPEVLGEVLADLVSLRPFEEGSTLAEEFDPARFLYVGILTVGIIGQYLGGKLADATRPERALVGVVGCLSVLALLFAPASTRTATFLGVSLLLGVALFTIQPLAQATVADFSRVEVRGLSYGFSYLAIFGVGALGASLAGAVLTYANSTALFLVLAAIAALSATTAFVLSRIGTRPA